MAGLAGGVQKSENINKWNRIDPELYFNVLIDLKVCQQVYFCSIK